MIRALLAHFRRSDANQHTDALRALERIWSSGPYPLGHATRRSAPASRTSSEAPPQIMSLSRWFLAKRP